jgi:hypothetical protein
VEESFLGAIKCASFNDIRQNEINKAGPLLPNPSAFEFLTANES